MCFCVDFYTLLLKSGPMAVKRLKICALRVVTRGFLVTWNQPLVFLQVIR